MDREDVTETIEQIAQRVLDTRGYLVVCSPDGRIPGAVLDGFDSFEGVLDHKLSLIGETDHEDFIAQSKLLKKSELCENPSARYWKVTAE